MGLKELTRLIASKRNQPSNSHSHVGCSSLNIEVSGESEGSDRTLVSAYVSSGPVFIQGLPSLKVLLTALITKIGLYFCSFTFDRPTSRLPLPEEKWICDSRNLDVPLTERKEEFLYYLFIHKGLSASLSNCAYLLLESHPRLPAVPLTETDFH